MNRKQKLLFAGVLALLLALVVCFVKRRRAPEQAGEQTSPIDV
jgi:hypothetical protein